MAIQQTFSPFNAFLQGRQARQQEEYGNTRNALAQMELQNAPAEIERRNKLADMQLQSAERALSKDQAATAYAQLQQALDSANPKAFVLQNIPLLAQKLQQGGMDLASMDDQSVAQLLSDQARNLAGQAGIAPTPQMETLQTDGGGILQRDPVTGALKQVVAPQKPDRFYEEQAAADRRAREQREFIAEQNRLNREAAAAKDNRKENDTIEQRHQTWEVYRVGRDALMSALKGTSTGPLAGRFPAVTSEQQTAEGAIAAMAPVLKQLFRSAGEGVFTDRDQELLLDMLPKRTDSPAAAEAKIANIDAIVAAKLGMQPHQANPRQQGAPPQAIEYLRANPQFKGAFFQKYGYLPDGI